MKVLVFETEEWEHAACLRLQPRHTVACHREVLGPGTPGDTDAEVISTFVGSRLDVAVLAPFPTLRLIATRSTGYDHVDLAYCAEHGITVCNVPDYGDSTVAEHAFALLLALSRRIVDAVVRTCLGDFSQAGLRGFDLSGKTLGVVGTGRIGRHAIAIARGFGMAVIAHDARPDQTEGHRLGFIYADLDEVLARADIVTLHLPASPTPAFRHGVRHHAAWCRAHQHRAG